MSDALREALDILRAVVAWADKYPSGRIYSHHEINKVAREHDTIANNARTLLAALRSDTAQPDEHAAGDCTGEGCDGGEVFVGSNGHPDGPDMGWTTCLVCGGSGKQPTNADIVKLREAIDGLAADLMVERWEREHTEAAQPNEQERALREQAIIALDEIESEKRNDAWFLRRIGTIRVALDGSQPKSVAAESAGVAHTGDTERCPRCGWTYAKSCEEGCVPGNCSFRPQQGTLDYARVKAYDAAMATDPTTDEGA